MRQSGADMALRRGLARPLVARRREEPVIRLQTDEGRGADAAGAFADQEAYHARFLAGCPGALSAAGVTCLSMRCPDRPRRVCLAACPCAKDRIQVCRRPAKPHAMTRPSGADRTTPDGVRSRQPVTAKGYSQWAGCRTAPVPLPNARSLYGSFQEIRHAYLPFWPGLFCVVF